MRHFLLGNGVGQAFGDLFIGQVAKMFEQLADLKATRLAAYVFVLGSFLAVVASVHAPSAALVGFVVLAAFVVAEIVNYAARIIYYRRGS